MIGELSIVDSDGYEYNSSLVLTEDIPFKEGINETTNEHNESEQMVQAAGPQESERGIFFLLLILFFLISIVVVMWLYLRRKAQQFVTYTGRSTYKHAPQSQRRWGSSTYLPPK